MKRFRNKLRLKGAYEEIQSIYDEDHFLS